MASFCDVQVVLVIHRIYRCRRQWAGSWIRGTFPGNSVMVSIKPFRETVLWAETVSYIDKGGQGDVEVS